MGGTALSLPPLPRASGAWQNRLVPELGACGGDMAVPSANTVVLFMLSALALNLSPGPSILFILSRCMAEGRRAAIVSVFGLATASVVQALAAAFGLATLF